jgi:hypothetical protein
MSVSERAATFRLFVAPAVTLRVGAFLYNEEAVNEFQPDGARPWRWIGRSLGFAV